MNIIYSEVVRSILFLKLGYGRKKKKKFNVAYLKIKFNIILKFKVVDL